MKKRRRNNVIAFVCGRDERIGNITDKRRIVWGEMIPIKE
jgi:hypothetical protein